MRPRYIKATKKDIEKSKDQKNGTGRGCAGTTNTGGTLKPDKPLREPGIQFQGTWIILLKESGI